MLVRLARRVAEGEVVTEAHECWVLVGVLVAVLLMVPAVDRPARASASPTAASL
jgi:hypothetical protein